MTTKKGAPAHGSFHALFTALAILIAAGGALMAIWFFVFYSNNEETNDAQIDQYVTPVSTRITGYIKEVRYEENQFVRKGDTLLIIDPSEMQAKLEGAQAEVQEANSSIAVLEKNVASTQSHVATQQSQLSAAEAEVWKTEREYKRYTALVKEDAATEQQLEHIKTAYDAALARYQEVKNTMQSTRLSTSEAAARIPVATTVIGSKKAAAKYAAIFLSYTVLIAPYDGWVGKKSVQPGQLVKEGQTLVSVVSKEKWVTANFKETQIAQLKLRQKVAFKVDAIKDEEFEGEVESLSPASGARFSMLPPDNATGNFVKIEQRIPVRIKLIGEAANTPFLRAGMNVTVTAPIHHDD